jgi:hypothetical protein
MYLKRVISIRVRVSKLFAASMPFVEAQDEEYRTKTEELSHKRNIFNIAASSHLGL